MFYKCLPENLTCQSVLSKYIYFCEARRLTLTTSDEQACRLAWLIQLSVNMYEPFLSRFG